MINKLFLDLNNFKANLGSVERGDSIELNIKLLKDEDYSRSKFRLLGAKSDGKSVEQIEGLNLEEKDLKVVLEDQFVNCEGIVKLELNVVSGETEITTKEFYFFVSNTMNAEIIDSADSVPTLEKVSKYVDDAVNNLDALKEASEDITIINSEFKENEIKRKANEMLREKNEKARLQSEDIRITEEDEREANELERIKAENNRKVSESNRRVSENTRVTNERAREEAEISRQSTFEENEEIRNSNENLRIASEKERIKFNNKAKTDEVNRKEAETKRVEAENTRVIAEDERKKAETSRQEAEDIRQNTYTNFNEAEEERRNNEISRQEAEVLRIEAEKRRDDLYSQKEEERNAAFLESERTRDTAFNEAQNDRNLTFEESEAIREEAFKASEAARNEAEEGRVAEELLRVEAEKLRATGEENRNNTFTQNEEERQGVFEEAENARKVAESKRVKAESSRVEAEKLRVTAETGRIEAENLRVTAEEERVAAETKREEGFNKFDGKINANTEELKNARSATTGEEFNSLDERIDHEVDRLNKKIEVSMLQQKDKESHVIENTVDGMVTDTVIKGRILQNLEPSHQVSMNIGSWNTFTNGSVSMYKPNTKYTVIVIVEDNKLNGEVQFIGDDNNVQTVFKTGTNLKIASGSTGVFSKTYTTKDDLSNCVRVGYWVHDPNSITGTLRYSMLILEGDWTNKPIPNYFEDIKSFGQQENKISYLSHGKNLLKPPLTNITKKQGVCDITLTKDGGFIINGTNSTTGGGRHLFSDVYFYKVTRGVSYTLSCTHVSGTSTDQYSPTLFLTNIDNHSDMPASINTISSTKKVTFVADKDMILFCGVNVNINQSYSNFEIKVMLEESKNVTQYEAYKEYKKDIALTSLGFDEGLRCLNNTVYDELNDIRNVAIKRTEKRTLTGNESWQPSSELQDEFICFYIQFPSTTATTPILCNNFIQKPTMEKNVECITNNGGGNSTIRIKIKKSKLVTQDVEGFKKWLKENPTTIYYELAEPVETPLGESINVKTFGERTHILFENSINGTSSFKAPVDAAATISRLNRENRALEEENKNLRQDFESTTLTLTDSDLELVKQNVDMDFRLMEVEFALDIPQAILSSDIKFKNKKGEVKSMARTPYEMMKIVILSGDYDREDYMHKVGKYYERGRMTKEEHDELMSLMTADEVISK
ncbi:hypothetical protein [Clostridium perfringens]|uniref:hypothetical protein n=1 Tax=Clostridium perfringens TaxID=1502 RepID=UPI00041CB49E|nr:hypothetical protein [Clostridium perfringens]